VRKALHQLKYGRNVALGEFFSILLSRLLVDTEWKIDVITPIPLGRVRQKERGYNQASLLARPLAHMLGICYQPKIVSRTRETQSQVELNFLDRKKNVAGAFVADGLLAAGKTVLIIDDILTSGSTINSCAEALLLAGSKEVYGMTVARARYSNLKMEKVI
jgi:ComF family protein